jgi:hypothetical protein
MQYFVHKKYPIFCSLHIKFRFSYSLDMVISEMLQNLNQNKTEHNSLRAKFEIRHVYKIIKQSD